MPANQSLAQSQDLSLRLSLQQLRFVKLLELNTPELEEAIDRELEDNPALEVADADSKTDDNTPYYRYNIRNSSPDDFADYDFSPPDHRESLYDHLRRQLSEKELPEKVAFAADFFIGSLDSNGYLRRTLPLLINDLSFGEGIDLSQEEARQALDIVRSLEPYGIGAADLRDCLRLQLSHLPDSPVRNDALEIIDNNFDEFVMKHTHKIISATKAGPERVKNAIDLILSLNPKPGASFDSSEDAGNIIIPDVIVNNEDGRLSLSLNNNIPDLAIEKSFKEAVAEMRENASGKRKKKKGMEFIISRYDDARDFIKILKQRQSTILNVMAAIMSIQEEYFRTEDVYKLKPMTIKDISAITGLDISVISRATNNKYVATPWGIFPMRHFFSDTIGDEENADTLTNRQVEAEIRTLVDSEDKKHPLSDEKIRLLINDKGYDVSRRTIAKYRDRLGIPVARLRKEL